MVVNDLYVFGAFRSPYEAHAPLVIDANAVLPLPAPFQGLKLIAGRHAQVFEDRRPVKLLQLPKRGAFDIDPSTYALAPEESLTISALEALDRHN